MYKMHLFLLCRFNSRGYCTRRRYFVGSADSEVKQSKGRIVCGHEKLGCMIVINALLAVLVVNYKSEASSLNCRTYNLTCSHFLMCGIQMISPL